MIGARLIANIIDLLICSVPIWLVGFFILSNQIFLSMLGIFFGMVIFVIVPFFLKFRTPGMIIFKLKLVGFTVLQPSFLRLASRYALLYTVFSLIAISSYFKSMDVTQALRALDASFFLVGAFPLFKGRYLTIWDQITQTTVISIEDENKEMPKPYWRYTKFLIIFIGLTVVFYFLKTP